ncbi:DUF3426 domain-containing protein [Marinobacter maritimus]|uniref:DUF3426 domain-containing protein n=1 Tax=Marinobacter maritimus TaxID=277961 RepID=UPI0011A9CDE3|nr:DUF3426 domain-containing protein [Marinobacter maritimus]
MPQSSLQTQCPKCRTRFRVTDEQLGIAKGKVRCGHCMDVFNAVEHQVANAAAKTPGASSETSNRAPAEASPRAPSDQPSPERSATGFASDITDENFIFADNPEEDAEEGRYAGTRLTFSDDELSDSFRGFDDRDSSARDHTDDDDLAENVDESWAEAILQEDTTPAQPIPKADTEKPQTTPEPEPKPEPPQKQKSFAEPAGSGATSGGEPTNEQPGEEASDFYINERPDPAFESFANEHGGASDYESTQQDEPFTASGQFGDLRHDPVSIGGNNKSLLRTVVWSVIVLGLVGVLIAQITWFQFDRLSAVPELRPFYEKGCELAGCELKPLINVGAIQSRKLVVRTDPENRSQLIVDAVIVNQADFQQPFPAIALTFSNLNGDVVAQSVFTPAEYLAGEGEELDIMPVQTPVRIAISIRDPGRDAVNYNISFRPYAP